MKNLDFGIVKVRVYPTAKAAGHAAAETVAATLRELSAKRDRIGVIFATGASQLETLHALTSIPDLPWEKVHGYHLDEYIGLDENHPASFRRYLRENLTNRVSMAAFRAIDGSAADPEKVRRDYVEKLRGADPQICLLGIGENGHLAFNDPHEADFEDPEPMKVVTLDRACREQQLAEGWFPSLDEVPEQALTLTIPTILQVPRLVASVPGKRKAGSVRRTLRDPISVNCPATILRTHPDVTIVLDHESASELDCTVAQ
ncbi:MAG TPA: glucosamine-6-phosphate deaminase [Acidobacteriaceae bacterium]|jgi:glucosamine-6-phosphate deaminase|nr:glucosamine-6-phosphate deaminase [Acidobacteriaceae bacterium]